MTLRPYQQRAVDRIFEEWKDNTSTLLVMPTGTGKTQVFADVIRRVHPRRALVLAHREELIYQAAKRIEGLGIRTAIEMADQVATTSLFTRAPVIVSTVQTQCAGNGRMTRFNPDDFAVVVVDEAHHATAQTYRRILDYYGRNPNLRILGVTATPDRADEQALGQVFQTVADDYEILDAINDGWLVPIEQQFVAIDGLDYSHIRTTAGDLNGADLAAVMESEQNLQGVAGATIDLIGDRRTLVFTASVKHAEMLAEIFCRHREGMAEWVHGGTPKDRRHQILGRFADGTTQVLCNCAVLTEGYDNVGVEVVVQGRATKSRCLYAQQIGRAMRPLAGVVDGVPTAEERRAAIAASAKPCMSAIDLVGNSGRHKLVSAADILGGKLDDEVVARATKRAQQAGGPTRTDEEIARAIAELEERKRLEAARKAKLVARASYRSTRIDPFATFDLQPERARGWDQGKQLSEKQRNLLLKQGVDPDAMPYPQARQLINELFRRWNNNLCSLKQANLLKRRGHDTREMSRDQASKLITEIADAEGWRR